MGARVAAVRSVDAVPRGRPPAAPQISAGALVLAASLPIVFLHIRFQPSVGVPFGGTLKLQDGAVLAVAVAIAFSVAREGLGPLRAAKPVWIGALLFLAWIVAATFYPLLSARSYAWRTHAVTAVEFGLYALLAPAVPLLVRRRNDAKLVLGTLVGWSVVATVIGVLQWLGWNIAGAWPQGDRQPSLLGPHDFAALSGMTLLAGIVGLLWDAQDATIRRGAWIALVSGMIGFVLAGATAGIVGLVPAVLIAAAAARRHRTASHRALTVALIAVVISSLGVVALRSRDFDQFFRFLGVKQAQHATSNQIQTYSQRTLLAYIGLRIWLHHPVVGAGWQGSTEPSVVGPELPAAHRRFPNVAPLAFPGPGHEYGVQLLYVQVLADLGLIGFALMLGWLGAPVLAGARASLRAPPGVAWIATLGVAWVVLALGLWTAFGLVAGVPLDALAWLAIGTAAAGMAAATPAASGRMDA